MGIRENNFDDDAYYADLEEWILKLMADDDDKENSDVALGADGCGYCITGLVGLNRGTELTRARCWDSLKQGGKVGTGVFIPQINNPGKIQAKNEKGRVRCCRRLGEEQIGGHKCKGGDIKIST